MTKVTNVKYTFWFFAMFFLGLEGGAALAVAGSGEITALVGLVGLLVSNAIAVFVENARWIGEDLRPPRPPRFQ